MRQILIRFDDICPTMNWEEWNRAELLLNKYQVKPLIGVIPNCMDPDLQIDNERPDFWEWVRRKQLDGYAIAMHGFNHVFCSPCSGILTTRNESEFAGMPFDNQLDAIRKGKEIFESHGIYTDIFFAPGHSYDENTIKALSICGFKYVSDGKSSRSYLWHGLKFLPCRNSGGPMKRGERYSTSIYHAHEWVKEDKNAYPFLENLLSTQNGDIVDFKTYKLQPTGNRKLQRSIEYIYVFLQFRVNPIIKKMFKKWK